jgi:HlyD family secretion protein
VDVYVRAPGIIRPKSEKHEVFVGVSGFVESVHLVEASSVEEQEILITIRARPTEARLETLDHDFRRAESAVADLQDLMSTHDGWESMGDSLRTAEYSQEAHELSARLAEVDLRVANELREFELAERQLKEQIIPRVEVANRRFELDHVRAERSLILEGTRGRWARELARLEEEVRGLRAEGEQLAQLSALHVVRSPTRGSLDEVVALSRGSFVLSGTRVAVISPDADLVAEILVPPQDVGLVRLGSPVVLRIDAFNPHEWGVLTGEVTTISGDILQTPSGPIFRVRTSLNRTFLTLSSGHRGNVRKGMTFEARFLVARRTLLQLLRDKVDDWVFDPESGDATS